MFKVIRCCYNQSQSASETLESQSEKRISRKDSMTTDQAAKLDDVELRSELLEMLKENYTSQGSEMPPAMYGATSEQLRRYWNALRIVD